MSMDDPTESPGTVEPDQPQPADEAQQALQATVLVCGRCKRILDGRYSGKGRADEAADLHVETAHADEGSTIVVPAPATLARSDSSGLVAIAAHAQRDLEQAFASHPEGEQAKAARTGDRLDDPPEA